QRTLALYGCRTSDRAPTKLELSRRASRRRCATRSLRCGRQEVVARQECLHQHIEPFGILDEAAMAGAGQDLVLGVSDQRRGACTARERVVMLAVHDQR